MKAKAEEEAPDNWHTHAEVPDPLAVPSPCQQRHEFEAISRLARETLVLVPLGLPFFVPMAFAGRLGLGFWSAFGAGLLLASVTVGLWLWLGPRTV